MTTAILTTAFACLPTTSLPTVRHVHLRKAWSVAAENGNVFYVDVEFRDAAGTYVSEVRKVTLREYLAVHDRTDVCEIDGVLQDCGDF